MSTYLVTGANGYIGANLVKRLAKQGNIVLCLVRPSSNLNLLSNLQSNLYFHYYNGTVDNLKILFSLQKIDAVFHLAAVSQYTTTADQVSNLIEANITLGTQILQLMNDYGVKLLINTGSYWQHLYDSISYTPVCLYAATKQAFESLIDYYVQIKAIGAVTLKLFDVYGPNDPRNKILQILYRAAISQEQVNLSPGKQLLDLVYIDDVVEAYCKALVVNNEGEHLKYFIGGFTPITLQELAKIYQNILGKDIPINWGGLPYRIREVMNPCQGKTLPNWHTKITLKQGLKKVVDYQLQNNRFSL
jgi:nucleoside-diphosphate-sugar epimerase